MRGAVERGVRRVLWVWHSLETLLDRLAAVGFIQTGVILAAQAFLALFPLLIAVTALFPPTAAETVAQSTRTRLGLSGTTDATMQQLIASRTELRGSLTVFGVVVVLVSATSFTRALQRLYELAWTLPRMGLRGSLRGLLWLVGLVVYLILLGTAVRLAGSGPPGQILRPTLLLLGAVVLWWFTPYLLLLGRVRLRPLLPGAVLTALAMGVLGKVSTVILPRTLANNERRFGTIGAVFAIESWLVVLACTLVAAVVAGALIGQATGPLGELARGTPETEGWRRVSSARVSRLSDPTRSSGTE